MDRRFFFSLVAFTFFLLLLYLVYAILAPFLNTLGWAAVIGISTFPLYRRLRQRLSAGDTTAASLMTPAVVIMFVVPFLGFLYLLGVEATQVYQFLEKVANGGMPEQFEKIARHPLVVPVIDRLAPYLETVEFDLESTLLPALKNMATSLIGYSTAIIKNFFLMIIKLVLMLITLFFFYRDGEQVLNRIISVLPIDGSDVGELIGLVRRVLSAVIYGIFLTCLVQGVLGGIGFWFCGLPSPILFGAFMAVAALIPVVGTALIWLPGAIYLILQGEIVKGIILLAWGGLVVGMIDNLIRPLFISGKAHLPIFIIALGVLGGVFAFGPIGVVAGPLVLAISMAIFKIYAREMFPGNNGNRENSINAGDGTAGPGEG